MLDKRFPEKEKTDEMAEILGEIFSLRAKEGESPLSFSTDVSAKLASSFPSEAQGWMVLRGSGLSDEQQAVVKGRALGDT